MFLMAMQIVECVYDSALLILKEKKILAVAVQQSLWV